MKGSDLGVTWAAGAGAPLRATITSPRKRFLRGSRLGRRIQKNTTAAAESAPSSRKAVIAGTFGIFTAAFGRRSEKILRAETKTAVWLQFVDCKRFPVNYISEAR